MAYYSRNAIYVRAYETDSRLLLHKPLPSLYPPDCFHDIAICVQGNRIVQFDHVVSPELQPMNHNNIPWANLLPAKIRENADTGLNTVMILESDGADRKYAAYIFQTSHQGLHLRFRKLLACVLLQTYPDHIIMYAITFAKGCYNKHYIITYKSPIHALMHNHEPIIESVYVDRRNIMYRYLHAGDQFHVMIFGNTLVKLCIAYDCRKYRPSIGSTGMFNKNSYNGRTAYDHAKLFAAKWMLVSRCNPVQTENFYSVGELYVSRSVSSAHVNTFTIIVPSSKSRVAPVLIATETGDMMHFMRIHQTTNGAVTTVYRYTGDRMDIRTVLQPGSAQNAVMDCTTDWLLDDLCPLTKNDKFALERCTNNIAMDTVLPHAEYYEQMPVVPESISIVHEIYRAKNVWPPKIRAAPKPIISTKVCAGAACRYVCTC